MLQPFFSLFSGPRSAFCNLFELALLEGVRGRCESVVKNIIMLLEKRDFPLHMGKDEDSAFDMTIMGSATSSTPADENGLTLLDGVFCSGLA